MSTTAVKTTAVTLANLQTAFNGESNAQARYLEFAKKADGEGFAGVASLFRAAAHAEGIHAANHAHVIRKMGADPTAFLEKVQVNSTRDNLKAAIEGEMHERDVMYPEFIKAAQNEGNKPAIRTFQHALEAEAEHARLYTDALATLATKKPKTNYMVCTVCGFTAEKLDGSRCPVCHNPKEKFDIVS